MSVEKIRATGMWVKRIGYLLAILGVGYMVWAYDLETIPEDFPHLAPQKMPGGTKVVTTKLRDSVPLGLGSVVIYRGGEEGEAICYGVIAGMPGEEIEFGNVDRGEVALEVGGRPEPVDLPPGHRLRAEEIPADHFLVLLGDRLYVTTTQFPDSRRLGLIPRNRILKKILVPLAFL
jgi:hypothetical protein